jgi:regulator of sigma E protease
MVGFLFFLWTLFLAFFLFGITVFVHEFGHFIVARKCGLIVQTFSIGFGKAIWQREKDGIVYKIGWIPFGGYVALPQLDPEGMDKIQGKEDGETFSEVSPWKKIAVSVAGPIGNIIFAVILAVAIWLIPGDEAGTRIRPVIGSVETNCAAYAVGMRAGDEITAVNGVVVNDWYDFSVETLLQSEDSVALSLLSGGAEKELTVPVVDMGGGERSVDGIQPALPCLFGGVLEGSAAEQAGVQLGDVALSYNGAVITSWGSFVELVQSTEVGASVALVVERSDEQVELTISPEYNEEHQVMMIGVHQGGRGSMPWMLYRNPIDQLKFDALMIVRVFRALTDRDEAPQAAKSLGGPVAIFGMLIFSIKTGLLNTLGLIRLLNVNLAILNLMPIPVLDGGHIVFALWHGITRRKVNAKMQAVLINVCAFLLIGAMLLVTFNDIDRKLNIKEFVGKLIPAQAEVE